MAQNYLFKEKTAADFIGIAEETARWIKTTEIVTPNGKLWKQSPDSAEDFSDYPLMTSKALYGGSPGVGLFYLRLFQATKKAEYLEEARAVATELIATDEGTKFYVDTLERMRNNRDALIHVKNTPGWAIGLYNGPAGSFYLVYKLYEITGEEQYKQYVIKAADDVLAVASEDENGLFWSDQGDLFGDAGFVPLLLSVYELTKDAKYLTAASKTGKHVLAQGKPAPRGGKFWNVVDLTLIGFPKDVFWVNFAHGSSGVGWIFAILYKATRDEAFLQGAIDAATYIKGIAVGDEDAVLVPYLDSLERGPSTDFYYLSICHGPAGTSILFETLYKLTGEAEYLAWVKKFARGIIKAGAPENYSRGYWPSQALCCGAPGQLEHFVSVYKLTHEQEFLTYAKRAANTIVGRSFVPDSSDIYKVAKTRRWIGNWWRTIPQETHSYTGLYFGSAGNVWSLLTLAALEKGEDYIDLLEHGYC